MRHARLESLNRILSMRQEKMEKLKVRQVVMSITVEALMAGTRKMGLIMARIQVEKMVPQIMAIPKALMKRQILLIRQTERLTQMVKVLHHLKLLIHRHPQVKMDKNLQR